MEGTTNMTNSNSINNNTNNVNNEAKDISVKRSSKVKKLKLPIKKIIPGDQFLKLNNTSSNQEDKKNLEEKEEVVYSEFKHEDEEFCIICICNKCLEYREIIWHLINDCLKTRSLWDILLDTLKKFYIPIIEKVSSPAVTKFYEKLVHDKRYIWLPNGILNKTKTIHIDFMAELTLTDNLTLVLLSALLTVDDAQQLLELLSYQIECFVRAYSRGYVEKFQAFQEGEIFAEDVILYILNGYEELNKVARKMTSFLFSFESTHLQQFSLTWVLLNKKLYQKWVHSVCISKLPDLILKLKKEVSAERYSDLVKKYIIFDEDIGSINKDWHNVWLALSRFYSSSKEQERRKRIKSLNEMFEAIKKENCLPFTKFIDIPDWEIHSNRQSVWENIVTYIKKKWPCVDECRIRPDVERHFCKKCNSSLEFHEDTCVIVGAPSTSLFQVAFEIEKQGCCLKCVALEKIRKDDLSSKVPDRTVSISKSKTQILQAIQSSVKNDGNHANGSNTSSRSMSPSSVTTTSSSSSLSLTSPKLSNCLKTAQDK